MNDNIEKNIAKNLADLRKLKKLKQSELAEKIGYSDKTISRWENGSTIPDIVSLSALADFYGVSIDDLTKENFAETYSKKTILDSIENRINELALLFLVFTTVWLIAVVIYVILKIKYNLSYWNVFIWAVPLSCIPLYYSNKITKNSKIIKSLIYSVMIWTFFTAIYLHCLPENFWHIFLIPIPIEVMIVFYNFFKIKRKKINK